MELWALKPKVTGLSVFRPRGTGLFVVLWGLRELLQDKGDWKKYLSAEGRGRNHIKPKPLGFWDLSELIVQSLLAKETSLLQTP